MPRIRIPDNTARKYLFSGNRADLIRKTGISKGTLYNRIKSPGDVTLDELAALVEAQELTERELYQLVTER